MPPAPSPVAKRRELDATLERISAQLGDVTPSNVEANWTVDRARALADAKRFLRSIDLTRRNLVIWIPGTSNDKVHPALGVELRRQFSAADTDVHTLRYMASWSMDTSMPTGLRTLRLVLAGIAAQGGNHRVLIAGESQGAWIAGEAASDPLLAGTVDRAVFLGHPITAVHHFDDHGDPRILEINNEFDKVTMQPGGSQKVAMEAVIALHQFHPRHLPTILQAAIENPVQTVLTGLDVLREKLPRELKPLIPDPHNYSSHMAEAARWLRAGAAPGSLPGDPASWAWASVGQSRRGARLLRRAITTPT